MKTLYLLRHAKSDARHHDGDDFTRPLSARGRRAAPLMGRLMDEREWRAQFVHCSTAERARQTWDGVAAGVREAFNGKARKGRNDPPVPPVVYHDQLYLSTPEIMIEVLRETPHFCDSALLIAHNPGIQDLALRLCGPGSTPREVGKIRHKYPTAALSVITIEGDSWRDIAIVPSRLIHFVKPADLEMEQP